MPLAYAFKHVFRSWKLFLALLIGITLASTFFAGTDIKANVTAEQALNQKLDEISVDITARISSVSTAQILQANEEISSIEGVAETEVISSCFLELRELSNEKEPVYYRGARIIGIMDNSHIYDGWLNRPDEIGENETYVLEGSPLASEVNPGDVIPLNFSVYTSYEMLPKVISLNLTVKGFAQLDDKACSIAFGYYSQVEGYYSQVEGLKEDLLIVDWNRTARKIMDAVYDLDPSNGWISTTVLIYIDRDALITPWDMTTSADNVETLEAQIENKIATLELSYYYVDNRLRWTLLSFQSDSMNIKLQFTLVSLPIFFMAWYMGTTVSNVSFNLRRREIGLLLTKGFSRGQILRIFLTETLLIGLAGGLLGVFLGFLLNPIFTQFNADTLFNPHIISPYTMILTVAFGIIIAFLSSFSSARKASQLATVDALREYLPLEEMKPYKKRWPWVAFILGTYKIIVFILGINMVTALSGVVRTGNFILILLLGILVSIDYILNYIGPLLFFWGSTKLFIQGSLKFQELTAKAARFLGDLGVLATKNVRRNPARSAATAFLLALIVGYSVQVTAHLATKQDYTVRKIYYQVGADIAVYIPYAGNASESNASDILTSIMENVSDCVQDATVEYSLSASSPTNLGITVRAVEPHSWLKTAYYEGEWFSGNDVTTAFNNLAADKNTVILERRVAKSSNLGIGEKIALTFGSVRKTLEVVGFFGPDPSEESQAGIMPQFVAEYWSYIPEELYTELSSDVGASPKIFLKLKGGADGKDVANDIRNLDLSINSVESFAEEWEEEQLDISSVGLLDAQRLGIIFAVLAASVGTALVSAVSMKERSREATIMSVKGLSYKQLIIMFLTENLALVTFSVILGVFVGFVIAYGSMSASNALISGLVKEHFVFPLDSTLMLFSCLALLFASTILPILIMSRKYVTQLERMVRLG